MSWDPQTRGSALVAAVYALQGARVSWPLEPATYDLLIEPAPGRPFVRVQAKTCTTRRGRGVVVLDHAQRVRPGARRHAPCRVPTDSLGVLAVVDGDGGVYLIPYAVIAHQATVTVRAYERYRVAPLSVCDADVPEG